LKKKVPRLPEAAPLIKKSIAVGSGKGGVGKTTTAVNLSIYYARKGFRVGLIDLDPLSDITTLLDLSESEETLKDFTIVDDSGNLEDHVIGVFENLDIIFPESKLRINQRQSLMDKIYSKFSGELEERYDILIFDLPAGSNDEDNLLFLPFMGSLIVVTNPEPTAHVSAGAYIRKLWDNSPETTIYLWHNRFRSNRWGNFEPLAVVKNYNRNVSEELRIPEEEAEEKTENIACIPEDPSLDLLRGDPAIIANIQRSMLDIIEVIQEERLDEIPLEIRISSKVFDLIKYYIYNNRNIENTDKFLEELGEYLKTTLMGVLGEEVVGDSSFRIFTEAERKALLKYLERVKSDPIHQIVLRIIRLLEKKIEEMENRDNPFFSGQGITPDRAIDRETGSLLMELNRYSISNGRLKNNGGLLLFYFSLYKLFQSPSMVRLISDFIPRKTLRGRTVRDRNRQIRYLVENNREYRKRFFSLIKTVYPVVIRQVSQLVKTFELGNLIFRNREKKVNREAYLKLLTNFIHDAVFSGLSVIIGFKYRTAAVAFSEGAEKILKTIPDVPAEPATVKEEV